MSAVTSRQIVRDLVEIGIGLVKDKKREEVKAKAHLNAEERVLDALVGSTASPGDTRLLPQEAARWPGSTTRKSKSRWRTPVPACRISKFPAMPGANIGVLNLSDMLGKAMGQPQKKIRYHPSRKATNS